MVHAQVIRHCPAGAIRKRGSGYQYDNTWDQNLSHRGSMPSSVTSLSARVAASCRRQLRYWIKCLATCYYEVLSDPTSTAAKSVSARWCCGVVAIEPMIGRAHRAIAGADPHAKLPRPLVTASSGASPPLYSRRPILPRQSFTLPHDDATTAI